MTDRPSIQRVRQAGMSHQVLTVVSGGRREYRREPCGTCPWRRDQVGVFPAEAFAHSAETAYDISNRTFGCHRGKLRSPLLCAGFLLRGADHNLSVRMMLASGVLDLSLVHDGGHELFVDYRQMAIANGVDPDDERLAPVRIWEGS